MTIISQEKTEIINYKNVTNINIQQEDNKFIIKCYFNIGNLCIGKYETEERAKEVLNSILNTFTLNELNTTYQQADLLLKMKNISKFEMPER